MQYLVISFVGDLFLNYLKELMFAVGFKNLLFTILTGHILYIECPLGHPYGRTYKAQLSRDSRRTEAVFHLNDRLNAPLSLKERIIDGLGLIRLFFCFPERCF